MFQRLAAEGADTRAHLDNWPFETEFWEKEVSVGRYTMQRSSLFFNQWLGSRVGEEVSPRATFTRFKQYVEQIDLENGQKIADLLPVIHEQAKVYEAWTTAADDRNRQLNRVELAVYRMKASDSELLKPLLIWLHAPGREVPADVIGRVTAIAESWLVRRQILRLSTADMGRIVADMIRTVRTHCTATTWPSSIERHLSRLNVTSTYWPGDDEIRARAADRAGVPPLQESSSAHAARGDRGRVSAGDQPAAGAPALGTRSSTSCRNSGPTTGRCTAKTRRKSGPSTSTA